MGKFTSGSIFERKQFLDRKSFKNIPELLAQKAVHFLTMLAKGAMTFK